MNTFRQYSNIDILLNVFDAAISPIHWYFLL